MFSSVGANTVHQRVCSSFVFINLYEVLRYFVFMSSLAVPSYRCVHTCVRACMCNCSFYCHPSNVQALWDKDSIYIVTPFYSGGEVFDALADRGRFEEDEARTLFRQALGGLLHLKRHGVCHR